MIINFTPSLKPVTLSFFLVLVLFLNGSFSLLSQTIDATIAAQKGHEDLAKRSQFSKHFLNEDGTWTAITTAGSSLNFKNTEDKWQTINNTIIASNSPISSEYLWENTSNRFQSYYPNEVLDGIVTSYTEGSVKEGLNKRMMWMDINYNTISEFNMNSSTANVNDRTIKYNEVFSGVDLEYTQLSDGRKMDYILGDSSFTENLSSDVYYLAFAEDIELPEGAIMVFEKNASGVSIINIILKEILVFRYELPKHYDSNGQETFSNYIVRGNTIYTLVKTNWLKSGLNYPVFIDPTLTVYPSGSGDYITGSIDNEGSGNKSAPANIYSGMRYGYGETSGTRRFFRAWSSFDVSTIPNGSTIDNVVFGCYIGLNTLNGTEGQYIKITPITSGIPNQVTGATLYNMCGENGSNAFFSVNATSGVTYPLNASIDLTSIAPSFVENSLAAGVFSLGFSPEGFYDAAYTEQVGIYGSNSPAETTNGRPYLIITYTSETIGLEDFTLETVGIYPNPVQSELTISSKQQVVSIDVYSLLGQLVLSEKNKNQIQVASLSNGVYLLQITLDNGSLLSRKIVKN